MTLYRTIVIIFGMALLQHNWNETGKKNYQLSLYESTSQYYYPAHIHRNQAELVYCSRGEFTHRIGGVNYLHKQGELRLIGERDIHMLRGSDFSYFNLAFPVTYLDNLVILVGREGETLFHPGPGGIIPVTNDFQESLNTKLDKLFKWEDSEKGIIPFTHFLLEILDGRLRGEEDSGDTKKPDWLNRSLGIMNETLSMEKALDGSCRSREHFTRTFKKYLGVSPLIYLNGLKMEKASRLLVRTNLPVKSIIGQCGFDNQNYFNRRFRDKFHMTPLEFRRRYLNRVH